MTAIKSNKKAGRGRSVSLITYYSTIVFFCVCLLSVVQLQKPEDISQHLSGEIHAVHDVVAVAANKEPTTRTHRTLDNYLPEEGLEMVASRKTDAATVREHLEHYYGNNSSAVPGIVYFITPTFQRHTQMVDLVRLSYTLDHDRAIYWIVVEDAEHCSKRVRDLLDRTGLPYAHLHKLSPPVTENDRTKGVNQRNIGLDVVQQVGIPGVVYFGDDDNAYDVRLFSELRKTKYVGVFGVAFAGGGMYERCIVDSKTGKIAKFVTHFLAGEGNPEVRKFQIDMGGMAFHTSAITNATRFSTSWQAGYLETKFVELVVESKEELEPLMDNCTKIYVWHIKTKKPWLFGKTGKMDALDSEASKIVPSI